MSESVAVGTGEGLYRILVDSVCDYAIFALDATGHVLSWNAGAKRANSTKRTKFLDGTGLGLAISREHAHGMHGSLIAANASEGGAVFTLVLPSA